MYALGSGCPSFPTSTYFSIFKILMEQKEKNKQTNNIVLFLMAAAGDFLALGSFEVLYIFFGLFWGVCGVSYFLFSKSFLFPSWWISLFQGSLPLGTRGILPSRFILKAMVEVFKHMLWEFPWRNRSSVDILCCAKSFAKSEY